MPLTQPPIDAVETERKCTELLNAFFKSYFDGGAHATSAADDPLTFPLCELGFNQMTPQLDKPLIHVVYMDLRPTRDWEAKEEIWVNVATILNLFVRVENKGANVKAERECRLVADRIKLLFEQPAERSALSQKGILHPRILRGPMPQPFPGVQVRMMIAACDLRYLITV